MMRRPGHPFGGGMGKAIEVATMVAVREVVDARGHGGGAATKVEGCATSSVLLMGLASADQDAEEVVGWGL